MILTSQQTHFRANRSFWNEIRSEDESPLHALILYCNTKFARKQRAGSFPPYKFNRLPVYRLQPSITKEISFLPSIFSSIYPRNENNFAPFFSRHVNNSGLIFLVILLRNLTRLPIEGGIHLSKKFNSEFILIFQSTRLSSFELGGGNSFEQTWIFAFWKVVYIYIYIFITIEHANLSPHSKIFLIFFNA